MTVHKTVLLNEAIDLLDIHEGDVVVDGTLGGGGHSEEISKRFGDKISLICLDADANAIERSKDKILALNPKARFIQQNFRNIDKVLSEAGIPNANKILLDIGLSSDQLEVSGRGFSFKRDEPLFMTFSEDPSKQIFTAKDIVNEWEEESIANVIFAYGEERFSRRIAKAIVEARVSRKIETTFDLSNIIEQAVPFWYKKGKIHPSTKTFQALRIAVNDELGALKQGIDKGFESLVSGGRLAVISFHSLEDRVVKEFFKQRVSDDEGKLVTKKPVAPEREEQVENPRSRSAKLRVIEKI